MDDTVELIDWGGEYVHPPKPRGYYLRVTGAGGHAPAVDAKFQGGA